MTLTKKQIEQQVKQLSQELTTLNKSIELLQKEAQKFIIHPHQFQFLTMQGRKQLTMDLIRLLPQIEVLYQKQIHLMNEKEKLLSDPALDSSTFKLFSNNDLKIVIQKNLPASDIEKNVGLLDKLYQEFYREDIYFIPMIICREEGRLTNGHDYYSDDERSIEDWYTCVKYFLTSNDNVPSDSSKNSKLNSLEESRNKAKSSLLEEANKTLGFSELTFGAYRKAYDKIFKEMQHYNLLHPR